MKVGDKCGTWTILGSKRVVYGKTRTSIRRVLDAACECGNKRKIRLDLIGNTSCSKCTRRGEATMADVETVRAFSNVCHHVERITGVSPATVVGYERDMLSSYARKVVVNLMRDCGISYYEIGSAIGREHSSVIRMIRETPREHSFHMLAKLADASQRRSRVTGKNKSDMPLKAFAVGTSEGYLRMLSELQAISPSEPTAATSVSEKDKFTELCNKLRELSPENAKKAWKDACKRMWPYTWEKQYRQPPMGLKFGSQEVLAL